MIWLLLAYYFFGVYYVLKDMLAEFNRITLGDVSWVAIVFWLIWPLIWLSNLKIFSLVLYRKK